MTASESTPTPNHPEQFRKLRLLREAAIARARYWDIFRVLGYALGNGSELTSRSADELDASLAKLAANLPNEGMVNIAITAEQLFNVQQVVHTRPA